MQVLQPKDKKKNAQGVIQKDQEIKMGKVL